MNAQPELPAVLKKAVGAKIRKVSLVEFYFEGKQHSDNTPMQLELDGEGSLFFDADGDGEALRIREGPWSDPFEGRLSQENLQFLERHGRLVLVDVSRDDPFDKMIGQKILDFEPVPSRQGKTIGMRMILANIAVDVTVAWDEVKIAVR